MRQLLPNLKSHFIHFKEVLMNSEFPRYILYVILAIDLFFVGLHVYTFSLPAVVGDLKDLRLDEDFGYAEMFQYVKFLAISLLLAVVASRRKKLILYVWSLFFLLLFADDAFRLHEELGYIIATSFNIPAIAGLRAQDFGELAASGVLGCFVAIPILYTHFFSSEDSRFVNMNYILIFSVLIFFGVGIDILHSAVEELPGSGLLTIVEDGGEMFAVSLILWYTSFLYHYEKRAITFKNPEMQPAF